MIKGRLRTEDVIPLTVLKKSIKKARLQVHGEAPRPEGGDRQQGRLALQPPAGGYGLILTFLDPAAALRRLDHLEGFRPDGPRHYDRIVVTAHALVGGEPVRAWCYVYTASRIDQIPGASRLGGGDWISHRRSCSQHRSGS